jgi:hypothetical protein
VVYAIRPTRGAVMPAWHPTEYKRLRPHFQRAMAQQANVCCTTWRHQSRSLA